MQDGSTCPIQPDLSTTPTCSNLHSPSLQSSRDTHFPKYLYHPPNPIRTLLLFSSSFTMPGHSRQDTALIHGLSGTEVDKLAEACVDAKAKAYCMS